MVLAGEADGRGHGMKLFDQCSTGSLNWSSHIGVGLKLNRHISKCEKMIIHILHTYLHGS